MLKTHSMRFKRSFFAIVTIFLLLIISGCRPEDFFDPPRLATATAKAQAETNPPTPTPLTSPLNTPQPSPTPATGGPIATITPGTSLTVWVNEVSDERIATLRQMADDFFDESQINIEYIFIDASKMADLVRTARLTGKLPDVILHQSEYTADWYTDDIISGAAATTLVERLGRDTFTIGALDQATTGGQLMAVPSDGALRLLVYRSDWFNDENLAAPDNFERIITAAEALHDPDNTISGVVAPTESTLVSTQYVFEHLAIANGCPLADSAGEIVILQPACLQTLDFYHLLINGYSPVGFQTDISTSKSFLAGRTAMAFTSPAILPQLEAAGLASKTGIQTTISGANFADLTFFSITTSAETDAALLFGQFWFGDGYLQWLSGQPEQKVPLRTGDSQNSTRFIDAWHDLPMNSSTQSIRAAFGDDTANQLAQALGQSPRWGSRNTSPQIAGMVYEKNLLAPLLQEMLSGYFNPSQTINEAYVRITNAIPFYQFYPATPTPEPIDNS